MRHTTQESDRMKRQIHEEAPVANFSAILPMSGGFVLNRDALLEQLQEFLGHGGPEITLDPIGEMGGGIKNKWMSLGRQQPETVLFSIGSVRLVVSHEHRPFETEAGLDGYCNPGLWPDGIGDAASHESFVTITELSDTALPHPDDVFDRAVGVTITAAAIAALHAPKFVLWQPAGNALPPELFDALVEDLMQGAPPLLLWTRWSIVPASEKGSNPGIVTRGLAPLIGREILAPPSHVPKERMLELVFRLANRMISWEVKPGDGDIIGDAIPCRLRHRRKSIFSRTPYFELRPVTEDVSSGDQ